MCSFSLLMCVANAAQREPAAKKKDARAAGDAFGDANVAQKKSVSESPPDDRIARPLRKKTQSSPTVSLVTSAVPTSGFRSEEELWATARNVTRVLGRREGDLHAIKKQGRNWAYFDLELADGTFFMKMPRRRADLGAWSEPTWTAWAAEHGWAPETRSAPGFADVLLTRRIPQEHLRWDQASKTDLRRIILRRLFDIHASMGTRFDLPTEVYTEAAARRMRELREHKKVSPLNIDQLEQRLVYLENILQHDKVGQTIWHGDTHPRNMIYHDGRLWNIDWSGGWRDPMQDVAKFATLAHLPVGSVAIILREYLGGEPSAKQISHLQYCMAVLNIDFYGADQMDYDSEDAAVMRMMERIMEDSVFLPDLPAVDLVARH